MYRKQLDLCIIHTPDFPGNFTVKKVRIIFEVLWYKPATKCFFYKFSQWQWNLPKHISTRCWH